MKKIYLVKQERWGSSTGHTYISDITDNIVLAKLLGVYHGKSWRGGKYCPKIIETFAPDDCEEVYVEMISTENSNGRNGVPFDYNLYFDKNESVTRTIGEMEESRLTVWKMNIETMDKPFDMGAIKDYLDMVDFFDKDVQKFIKDRYEKLLREESSDETV